MPTDSKSKEWIIAEIRRLATGDKPPGIKKFREATGLTEYQIIQYWPSWNDAVIAAGFLPNRFQTEKTSNDVLLRHLANYTRELGQFPTSNRLKWAANNLPGFPFDKTLYQAFGSKHGMISSLQEWVLAHEEYHDILELLSSSELPNASSQTANPIIEEVEIVSLRESYLPPVIDCLSELASASEGAQRECTRLNVNISTEFERRTAIAFELLGLTVERLGQGSGRKPDGIAKCFDQRWAIIYDAKVRTSPYRLLTEEDRKFREYIEREEAQLRSFGITKQYFAVVSSGFSDRDISKARELVRLTNAKSCVLVEVEALMKLVDFRLRSASAFSIDNIERLFQDTKILRASDV